MKIIILLLSFIVIAFSQEIRWKVCQEGGTLRIASLKGTPDPPRAGHMFNVESKNKNTN
jgi:hypothetical protein